MISNRVRTKRYNKFAGKRITTNLLILFVFIIAIVFLAPNLGQWLVIEDALQKSDIIVVLTGSLTDRILQAVDVYNERYSGKIVLVNSDRIGYDIFVEKGVKKPLGDAQLSKMVAMNLGVAERDVLILEGNAQSTQDEALIIGEYIKNDKIIESIIVVTSKYHSGRAKKIFEKVLNSLDRKIEVYSSPSKYDSFNSSHWWKNKRDIYLVMFEYLKLANFYLREQFLIKQ